jgi:hypothetical protein
MVSELNTPQWLFIAVIVLSIGALFALAIWGVILEIRYLGPYTLASTDGKERWRRAVILALLQTGILPIMGLLLLTLSPYLEEGFVLPLFCGSVWVVAFLIGILYHRWDFERTSKRHQKLDNTLKSERKSDRYKSPQMPKFIQIFMTAELQRFMKEGYSQENGDKALSAQNENQG